MVLCEGRLEMIGVDSTVVPLILGDYVCKTCLLDVNNLIALSIL